LLAFRISDNTSQASLRGYNGYRFLFSFRISDNTSQSRSNSYWCFQSTPYTLLTFTIPQFMLQTGRHSYVKLSIHRRDCFTISVHIKHVADVKQLSPNSRVTDVESVRMMKDPNSNGRHNLFLEIASETPPDQLCPFRFRGYKHSLWANSIFTTSHRASRTLLSSYFMTMRDNALF
jgi:hypothetical protein